MSEPRVRALIWIVEDTWEATIAEAAAYLPPDAGVTILHVADSEPEGIARAARHGLLGRHPPPPRRALHAISEQAARQLLDDARTRLGRAAELCARRGRIEREVVAAAEAADILVLARDGDREHLGPRSLGPAARFVIDHAPCRVLLVWPDVTPSMATMPPPPDAPDAPGH